MKYDEYEISPNGMRAIAVALIIFGFIGMIAFTVIGTYNACVDADTLVLQMQSNVQTSLEARADMIPNIISTISTSSLYERNLQVDIVTGRMLSNNLKTKVESATSSDQLDSLRTDIDSSLGRLQITVEQYPDIKSTAQYQDLQNKLQANENQIRADRNMYNAAVRVYQVTVRRFPENILSGFFGYTADRYKMFSASSEKAEVPIVKF